MMTACFQTLRSYIYLSANTCKNANNCWHFNIFRHAKLYPHIIKNWVKVRLASVHLLYIITFIFNYETQLFYKNSILSDSHI